MICIYNKNTDPYFNLAAEEYLLKAFKEEFFMLWRNRPSVIIGKNQNALAEINLDYIKGHNIPVVRRLSGGGAVFHDLGNINFTFIVNNEAKETYDFERFVRPIISALGKLGINAEFSGRNDITIDGRKVSGNAQCYYSGRILHHGTLLVSSDISDLSAAINAKPMKFEGKGIKSVAARITNIDEYLQRPMSVEDIIDMIMAEVKEQADDLYEFTGDDMENIERLKNEKYSTWEWNFGISPDYSFKNEKKFAGGTIEINIDAKDGVIEDIKIFGDFFCKKDIKDIETLLKGVRHSYSDMMAALASVDVSEYFCNISLQNLLDVLL